MSFQSHTLSRNSFLKVMMSGVAGVLSTGFAPPLSLRAAVPTATEPLIPGLTPFIRLYGATATEIGGNAKMDSLKISVNCKDSSGIKWNITAPEAGEYDLFISCAVPGPHFQLEVISGPSSVKSELKITEGVYRSTEDGWYFNFERKRLDGRLHLSRGVNPITLQLSAADKDQGVRLRCLEVVPVSASVEITAAEASARPERASTDWFVKAGYGAMFHYLDGLPMIALARYNGYDISDEMLRAARESVPDYRAAFINSSKLTLRADYALVSGTFNVKLQASNEEWTEYVKESLVNLSDYSTRGFAFNLLTTYVDWKQENLFYADPFLFFDFCKRNISRYVSLLHDYPLYEWTIIVRKEHAQK